MSKIADTFKNAFSLILQDVINLKDVAVSKRFKSADLKSEELIKTGYTVIPNFLPKNECDNLYKDIISLSEKYPTSTKLDNGTYIGYRSSNTANGPDKGMIDIDNIEKSIQLNLNYEEIEKIVRSTTNSDIYFLSVHAYVNRSVKGTRIFHVDNCQPVIYKAFIYLTDVSDVQYGPYAFIKGTHRFSLQVYNNLVQNLFKKKYRSTDMPVYNASKEIIGIGGKGTAIISNQNGIHRGYPQTKDKERVALVLTYMVVSKLNYIHNTAKLSIQKSLKKL